MIKEVKKDIIHHLKQVLVAIEEGDYEGLVELSNHTIHDASIYQDQDSISYAVVVYVISKIIVRTDKYNDELIGRTKKMIDFLEESDYNKFRAEVKSFLKYLSGINKKLGYYIQDVVTQAMIKKGSKLYEHGLSIAKTAELMGLNQWELMDYIGKTTIIDESMKDVKAGQRLKIAKRIFEA